jgi:hypothetical protein
VLVTKASDDPPGCAAQFPDEQWDSFEVFHDPETGDVTVVTSQGEFQGTLDEQNCGQDAGCYADPGSEYCYPNGCTAAFQACFTEGNPAIVEGSTTTSLHDADGAPCEGPISCTVVYDFYGQRNESSEGRAAATSGLPSAPAPTGTQSAPWKALEAVLAGARALLERILPGF